MDGLDLCMATLPVEKIKVVLGSSNLPPGPTSGGSTATSTILPSVVDGVNSAIKVVLNVATNTKGSPFFGKDVDSLMMTRGPTAACPSRKF